MSIIDLLQNLDQDKSKCDTVEIVTKDIDLGIILPLDILSIDKILSDPMGMYHEIKARTWWIRDDLHRSPCGRNTDYTTTVIIEV